MPNIVLEAMKSKLPIASSNYDPMNEFLENNAFYFNPLNIDEIENSLINLINDSKKRKYFVNNNNLLVSKYSWIKCANETYKFLTNFK